jgi:hypothetical protein
MPGNARLNCIFNGLRLGEVNGSSHHAEASWQGLCPHSADMVLERAGRFAVFADEPFDEGADLAPRVSCGDDRTGRSARQAG